MKRLLLAASLCAGLFVPAVAVAKPPTRQHIHAYNVAYYTVQREFGHRTPGRNIIRWGFDAHHKATDQQVVTSLQVLQRMLAPPPAPSSSQDSSGSTSSGGASSGLADCIIQRESSGNPNDVSGQYSGLANWSQSSWEGGGGTKYAPTPTQASPDQQRQVLDQMLANGQSGQWTPYDGC